MAEGASGKRVADAGGGDRLSALPDELLHSIMSFLPSRQVVQTTVLSRRWRGLWRSTPCLAIDYREFAAAVASSHNSSPSSSPSDSEMIWRRLLAFTRILFKNHDAPVLERFQLHLGAWRSSGHVESWLRRGITSYRAAALEVTAASSGYLFTLPPPVPATATACRLTRMRLGGVWLGGSFADHLRSGGFPVLEELELVRCYCGFMEIVSPTLKSLAVEHCFCPSSDDVYRSVVTAPALVSFRLVFVKSAIQDALLLNGETGAGSPLRAFISADCEGFCIARNKMLTLLGSLCNVVTLELWRLSYQNLDTEKEKFPILPHLKTLQKFPSLPNLKTLLMGKCEMSKQFRILRCFLINAPSLEKVTLKHCQYPTDNRRYTPRKIAPRYWKLVCYNYLDLKLIGIKYRDSNTSNLFGLLMGIRMKLKANTVILNKELCTNSTWTR